MAGAGKQGFREWQAANMFKCTNKLVTDLFTAVINYVCGLPHGSGFLVEITNLYSWVVLMWWNMDAINNKGQITSFEALRHGFPLTARQLVWSISSFAYVDDANQYTAIPIKDMDIQEFFTHVQAYCNLMVDLLLVIKMGRNVKKCIVR